MTTDTTPATTPPRALSVRLGVGSAIFQSLLVVLGVVLGFIITEWQADQSRRAEARHALAGILEEIAVNRDAIAAARAYHADKTAMLSSAAGARPDIRAFDRGFVAPAQVSAAAWSTAGETGALANLPFDQVLSLSRIYSQQSAYTQQQATVSAIIYSELFARGPQGILDNPTGLRSIIDAFRYREQQLEAAYEKTLTEIRMD